MNTRRLLPLFLVVLLPGLVGSAAAQEDHSADSSKVERKESGAGLEGRAPGYAAPGY